MIWRFDCDGTICFTDGTDYEKSKPDDRVIGKINKLYDAGETIIIWTGRGSRSGINWRDLTAHQLKEWGVKYHELIMGKPAFDYFVDDLAWNVRDFLNDNVKNTNKD